MFKIEKNAIVKFYCNDRLSYGTVVELPNNFGQYIILNDNDGYYYKVLRKYIVADLKKGVKLWATLYH